MKETGRKTHTQPGRLVARQTDRQTDRQRERDRQTHRQADRERDRQTHRQTGRQTGNQAKTYPLDGFLSPRRHTILLGQGVKRVLTPVACRRGSAH